MKKKFICTILGLVMLFSSTTAFSASNSEPQSDIIENSGEAKYITSGEFYDRVQDICPGAYIFDSGSGGVTIDISCIGYEDDKTTAIRYIKFVSQMIGRTDFSDTFDDITIVYTEHSTVASINTSDFKDTGNFTCHLLTSGDNDLYKYITAYYNDVLGRFSFEYQDKQFYNDLSKKYKMETEAIDICTNDKFWLFSSFNESAKYVLEEQLMTVVFQTGYTDTESSGYEFYDAIYRGTENFAHIYNTDKDSLTFSKIGVLCCQDGTDDLLAFAVLSIDSDGSWITETLKITGNNFKTGFLKRSNTD